MYPTFLTLIFNLLRRSHKMGTSAVNIRSPFATCIGYLSANLGLIDGAPFSFDESGKTNDDTVENIGAHSEGGLIKMMAARAKMTGLATGERGRNGDEDEGTVRSRVQGHYV